MNFSSSARLRFLNSCSSDGCGSSEDSGREMMWRAVAEEVIMIERRMKKIGSVLFTIAISIVCSVSVILCVMDLRVRRWTIYRKREREIERESSCRKLNKKHN